MASAIATSAPILVVKNFNNNVLWAVPLTRTFKPNRFYFRLNDDGEGNRQSSYPSEWDSHPRKMTKIARLPGASARELVRALEKAGFDVMRQKGGHVTLHYPETDKTILVAMHPAEVPRWLFKKGHQEDAGLIEDQFRHFLLCGTCQNRGVINFAVNQRAVKIRLRRCIGKD